MDQEKYTTGAPMLRFTTIVSALVFASSLWAQSPSMVQFQVAGQSQSGLQLINVPQRLVILGRDGWLHDTIDGVRPRVLAEIPGGFRAATAADIRGDLRNEFGRDFEVVATTHYLVVQPVGRGDRWPQLFEGLYREFVRYMDVRGVKVRTGRFPLVAVVMPDQQAMQDEFDRLDIKVSRVAGVYHLASNRVIMHDQGHAGYVAETVRHETAHQTAYNVGVHSRVSETPRWVVEGIGGLFEPAAMQGRQAGRSIQDRQQPQHTARFIRQYQVDGQLATDLQRIIADDSMFRDERQITGAYSLSWAMTFYLAERQPQAFAKIVQHTGRRAPFRAYPRDQRLEDFERLTGTNVQTFAKQLNWFMQSL
ncbi:DUF1570 domain-containing protein [Roseimaritima ulvae]|nr:DUF1570 domain-containing protein [Roseimaritima ulvae]